MIRHLPRALHGATLAFVLLSFITAPAFAQPNTITIDHNTWAGQTVYGNSPDYALTSPPNCFTRAAMSSALHAVVRGPSLTGLGKRPFLHPSHHALLLMGTMFKTCGKRRNPVAGMDVFIALFSLVGC